MKLYYFPGACSLATHLALEESGLAYTAEAVNLRTKQTASGRDFHGINPKGYVPALELDGGEVITEVSAILQYVAELAPEKQLAPTSGLERVRLNEWLCFIATELHKNFAPLFNPANSDEIRKAALERLAPRLNYVETWLDSRPYLLGAQLSVADLYLFTVLSWANFIKAPALSPVLGAYLGRIAQRPAVQAVLTAEGLKG
ncbi:glutathione transferase GstA [Zoogloea sp.]|uniref:glutathione transferase GstA n=1 Tax=Zoogloea sp. TaxID=49181 RepID=UPI0035B24873